MKGELNEGDPLPSMRLLAKELRISVITTKRAYEDLERDGFIESIMGKGSFVSRKNMEFIREEQLRNIEEKLQAVVEISNTCGIKLPELIDILTVIYNGE